MSVPLLIYLIQLPDGCGYSQLEYCEDSWMIVDHVSCLLPVPGIVILCPSTAATFHLKLGDKDVSTLSKYSCLFFFAASADLISILHQYYVTSLFLSFSYITYTLNGYISVFLLLFSNCCKVYKRLSQYGLQCSLSFTVISQFQCLPSVLSPTLFHSLCLQ